MKAQDIMSKNPRTVTPDTVLVDAARVMRSEEVGLLPVVEAADSRRLIGVITDRDITIRHVAEGHGSASCPVSEAMTAEVRTCKPDDDVKDIMEVMGREQVRRLPVVDERGSVIGIVAQADIVRKARDDKKAEQTVERISAPGGRHSQ